MKNDMRTSAPDRQPDGLAAFLSAAKPLNRLTPEQGRKIQARVLETLVGKPSSGFRWRWSTALAAIGLVLFGGAAAAAAARYGLLPWARVERTQDHGETEKARGSAHDRTRARKPEAVAPAVAPTPVDPASPVREPSSQADEPARAAPVTGRRTSGPAVKGEPTLPTRSMARADPAARPASAASKPAFTPTPLTKPSTAEPATEPRPVMVDEQAVLSEALRRLRQERDAAGSLALLDQLEISHPQSDLALERSNLQVEALLTLGREKQALARLDGMALDALPRSGERYLVRGELRARCQRWPEARDDFEHALSNGAGTPIWHERALWGRGVARIKTGDRAGGEADLKRYLTSYPSGRHAAEAERMLAPSR